MKCVGWNCEVENKEDSPSGRPHYCHTCATENMRWDYPDKHVDYPDWWVKGTSIHAHYRGGLIAVDPNQVPHLYNIEKEQWTELTLNSDKTIEEQADEILEIKPNG